MNNHTQVVLEMLPFACATHIDALGNTLLHAAVLKEDLSMTRSLIEAGCSARVQNNKSASPFSIAVSRDMKAFVQIFVDVDERICKETTPCGTTCLHIAARYGNIPMMQLLLRNGADLWALNQQGQSAIYQAVSSGRPAAVAYLDKQGLSLSGQAYIGYTPLLYASLQGQLEVVKSLCSSRELRHEKASTSTFPRLHLSNILHRRKPDTIRFLRPAGSSALVSDLLQQPVLDGSWLDLIPDDCQWHDGPYLNALTDQHLVRGAILHCTRVLQHQSQGNPYKRRLQRSLILPTLISALSLLGEHAESDTLNCCLECFFGYESINYWSECAHCQLCDSSLDDDLYTCCLHNSALCVDCYDQMDSGNGRHMPEGYAKLRDFENMMCPLRDVAEKLDLNIALLGLTMARLKCTSAWVLRQCVVCDALTDFLAANNKYYNASTWSHTFFKSLHEAIQAFDDEERTSIEDLASKSLTAANDNGVHQERDVFICLDDNFTYVTKDELNRLTASKEIFDVNGCLTDLYLSSLQEKYCSAEMQSNKRKLGTVNSLMRSAAIAEPSRQSPSVVKDLVSSPDDTSDRSADDPYASSSAISSIITLVHEELKIPPRDSHIMSYKYNEGKRFVQIEIRTGTDTSLHQQTLEHLSLAQDCLNTWQTDLLQQMALEKGVKSDSQATPSDREQSEDTPLHRNLGVHKLPDIHVWRIQAADGADVLVTIRCDSISADGRLFIASLRIADALHPGFALEYCKQRSELDKAYERRLKKARDRDEAGDAPDLHLWDDDYSDTDSAHDGSGTSVRDGEEQAMPGAEDDRNEEAADDRNEEADNEDEGLEESLKEEEGQEARPETPEQAEPEVKKEGTSQTPESPSWIRSLPSCIWSTSSPGPVVAPPFWGSPTSKSEEPTLQGSPSKGSKEPSSQDGKDLG